MDAKVEALAATIYARMATGKITDHGLARDAIESAKAFFSRIEDEDELQREEEEEPPFQDITMVSPYDHLEEKVVRMAGLDGKSVAEAITMMSDMTGAVLPEAEAMIQGNEEARRRAADLAACPFDGKIPLEGWSQIAEGARMDLVTEFVQATLSYLSLMDQVNAFVAMAPGYEYRRDYQDLVKQRDKALDHLRHLRKVMDERGQGNQP